MKLLCDLGTPAHSRDREDIFRDRDIDPFHTDTSNGREYDNRLVSVSDIESYLSDVSRILTLVSVMNIDMVDIVTLVVIMIAVMVMRTMTVVVMGMSLFRDVEKVEHG